MSALGAAHELHNGGRHVPHGDREQDVPSVQYADRRDAVRDGICSKPGNLSDKDDKNGEGGDIPVFARMAIGTRPSLPAKDCTYCAAWRMAVRAREYVISCSAVPSWNRKSG